MQQESLEKPDSETVQYSMIGKMNVQWMILFLLLLTGIILPRIVWHSIPERPLADPEIGAMRFEYASAHSWLELNDDAQRFASEIQEQQLVIKNRKVDQFNATISAEQGLSNWVKQNHLRSQESIEEDPIGGQLIVDLSNSYARQQETRLYLEAIDSIQDALKNVHKEVRKHLVGKNDTILLDEMRDRMVELRLQAADNNADRRREADALAKQAVHTFSQRMVKAQ